MKVPIQDWLNVNVPGWRKMSPEQLGDEMHNRWKAGEFKSLVVAAWCYTQSTKTFVEISHMHSTSTYSHVVLS